MYVLITIGLLLFPHRIEEKMHHIREKLIFDFDSLGDAIKEDQVDDFPYHQNVDTRLRSWETIRIGKAKS
jgi:hypothetical protein